MTGVARAAVAAIAAAVTVLTTIALDRLVGACDGTASREASLIFPPHVSAVYDTTEFTSTAASNALGFRDREFAAIPHGCRGLAIGDSFTFGWGVEADASWPKVLEATLRAADLDVEIANLGRPGAGPVDYTAVAERAIPLLRPDFVLVGVLQGDDLRQADSVAIPTRRGEWQRRLTLTVQQLYPNLSRAIERFRKLPAAAPLNIQDAWQRQADEILHGLTASEREHYGQLDAVLRSAFAAGRLNPWLVQMALRDPTYFLSTFEARSPLVDRLVERMATALAQIADLAARHGAATIVVAVPFGIYVNRPVFEARRAMGFALDDRMLVADVADAQIQMAAERAGLPFISVADGFRRRWDERLFFPLDNHLNDAGHRLLAHLIAARLPDLPAHLARCPRTPERPLKME